VVETFKHEKGPRNIGGQISHFPSIPPKSIELADGLIAREGLLK